ncbi:MAG: coenzyme F420-0:L-glutamate ligase [Microbacteriaceae bacterium]
MTPAANEGKSVEITVDGVRYQRIPIKTRVFFDGDDLSALVTGYAGELLRDGDILFVTEKIVAISQGRSYPVSSITPRPLAVTLARYVTKTPYGIGLGMPETMEMALRECGTPRILLAALVAALTKPLGRRGDFYRVAGPMARGIDGPTSGTIPPYNSQVVLSPLKPRAVANDLKRALGKDVEVHIVDINDIGGNILGSTAGPASERTMVSILRDNPLGQGHQSTPMGIVRRID